MASGPEPLGRGTIPSPNLWRSPEVYELENLASDRAGVIDAAIGALHPWAGARVLDVGCGSGFHLPQFASYAAAPLGVEPHLPLAVAARDRLRGSGIGVIAGSAEALPLADASMDIAHARWAYFFGPGCEPGLAELARIVRPGGIAMVLDNDATRSTFGGWFARAWPDYDAAAVHRFWVRQGWRREPLLVEWAFDSRADFEAVLGWEFEPRYAASVLAADPDRTSVDYAVNLWWRVAGGVGGAT